MHSPKPHCAQEDLEQRLKAYELLHQQKYWPGSMSAWDYWAAFALAVVLVVGFAWWAGV